MSRVKLFLVVTVLLAVALPALAQGDASWADRISINGYFQTRYEAMDAGEDGFTLPRMYINLMIDANERTKGVVTWTRLGGSDDSSAQYDTDWANIFVDYAINDQWTARIGQAGCWFGLECWQGSSQRMALERARVVGADGQGVYFAGPWDRGVWFVRKPADSEPTVILGVSNGQFRNTEADTSKNVSIDLKWDRDWGTFGASWLNGKYAASPTTDRSALAGYVRWAPPNSEWAFQGEYVDGELFGSDIDGWYAQLERSALTEGGTAFVKWENYDPNTAAASPNDEYKALHVGYSQWLDENNEITVQYTDAKDEGVGTGQDTSCDEIAAQWQFGFR